jgi:hypothetical protein
MLIAPAGEWRVLAEHLETGKIKSSARFLVRLEDRQTIAAYIREQCAGRIDTAQVGLESRTFEHKPGWPPDGERSLAGEAKKLKLTGFRIPDYWADYGKTWEERTVSWLDFDTLKPLKELSDRLAEHQHLVTAAFQRACFALDPSDREGSAGAVTGRDWCYWHDPDRASHRADAQRRGGENRSRQARAKKLLARGLDDLSDLDEVPELDLGA